MEYTGMKLIEIKIYWNVLYRDKMDWTEGIGLKST